MDKREITEAIWDRLRLNVLGIEWCPPNVNKAGIRPRAEVTFPEADREGRSLKGNQEVIERGTCLVVVVTDQGIGPGEAEGFAEDICAALYEGLRMNITGGEVAIIAPPSIQGGFPDGDKEWRLPVLATYYASATT